jgi:hypothetical protein
MYGVKPPKELNPRQIAFCEEYVQNGGIAARAYETVGYKPNPSHAVRMLVSNGLVQQYIANLSTALAVKREQKADVTLERIQQKCQEYQDLAVEKGDLASAIAALRLEGQTIAAFKDTTIHTDLEQVKKLAESKRKAAKELAELLNKRKLIESREVKSAG